MCVCSDYRWSFGVRIFFFLVNRSFSQVYYQHLMHCPPKGELLNSGLFNSKTENESTVQWQVKCKYLWLLSISPLTSIPSLKIYQGLMILCVHSPSWYCCPGRTVLPVSEVMLAASSYSWWLHVVFLVCIHPVLVPPSNMDPPASSSP